MDHDNAQALFDELSAPFPVEMIEWRVGQTNEKWVEAGEPVKGLPLCYIDARAVMDRLDTTCGPDGWQCNYSQGVNGSIVCNIGIRLGGEWIWKADGAGATDFEGEKGALSDAFKRAAVRWGIGRYLYDLHMEKIVLEKRGKSFVIPKSAFKDLNDAHEDFAQKAGWGPRSGIQVYRLLKKSVGLFVTDAVSAQEFKAENKSEISLLPVAMRRHLFDLLDRIGGNGEEQAA
jgi:hypothetical protein